MLGASPPSPDDGVPGSPAVAPTAGIRGALPQFSGVG
jgi:hypothetical protein